MITSTIHIRTILDELRSLRDHKKQVIKREEDLKQRLYNHMNEHEEVITEDGEILATWKYSAYSQYFDTERFQKDSPHLYEQYIATRPGTRRLVIK